MTDCVDAPMYRMKPAMLKAAPDRPAPNCLGDQLPASHHTVLAAREVGYELVHMNPLFCIHVVLKC